MGSVKTIVLKVGTNVLSREHGGMALGRIHSIIEEIADLRRQKYRVILVSSGAVSMGMHRLGEDGRLGKEPRTPMLKEKQAYAAVGQIRLMSVYQQALGNFGIPAGQILLTEDDFSNRERYLNLRNTMHKLLELGVVPIVNENDSVSTLEIEESVSPRGNAGVFGDNDKLSALVASKLGADLLLIASDVDGLYPDGPPKSADDKPISVMREINAEVEGMAGDGTTRGRGGMRSKLEAIKVAVQSGSLAVIVNGIRHQNIGDAIRGVAQRAAAPLLALVTYRGWGTMEVMVPHSGGGATPITPKNALHGMSTPQGSFAIWASRSSGMFKTRLFGKSSGREPLSGMIMFHAQSWRSWTSIIRTSSTSPGSAPRTATGPVMI